MIVHRMKESDIRYSPAFAEDLEEPEVLDVVLAEARSLRHWYWEQVLDHERKKKDFKSIFKKDLQITIHTFWTGGNYEMDSMKRPS